jgi:fatty-acyl-CoA synthase
MTEMSPLGSLCKLQNSTWPCPRRRSSRSSRKQGHVPYGVDWKIVDGDGKELPWDGKAFGDLYVRGPWIVRGYFKGTASPLVDGWFPTGDVATIDPDGYMQITDRSKDVIKSGGEWISSIDLENLADGAPAVLEAAVIGVPPSEMGRAAAADRGEEAGPGGHARGAARALRRQGRQVVDSRRRGLRPELPHTATGKLLKTKLRETFRDHTLASAAD